jgi:GT2 family glycosyltransferase/glycosyltransferase involved in cell wall biosynthesis
VNFLFVNYGDFTSNSLNHIGAFANQLTTIGHSCVVVVPEKPETISVIVDPLFTAATFARALEPEPLFADRRPADVVHAWTPRENVREFTLAYLRQNRGTALLIHLEDNEEFLMESFAHEPIERLKLFSDEDLAARLSPRLSHPIRYRNFLRVAHAATCITDRLREFVPTGKATHRLLPGLNLEAYRQFKPDPALRESIGVKPHEKLIVFPGSTTFANVADIRALMLAVRLINERGTPCKLVRAGFNPPNFAPELAALGGGHVIDLGFIPKSSGRLEPLLALADILVQPGIADAFNDYRLPSKLPEFLSMGRPVVTPRANLAREMEEGRHALLLDTGTPDEIAEKCLQVFGDDALAQRLSEGALEFARIHFDLKTNTDGLFSFYQQVKAAATPIFSDENMPPSEDVLLADGDSALRMRAKELTISAHLKRIAELETEAQLLNQNLGHLQSEKTLLIAQSNYQHAKIEAGKNQLEVVRGQLGEAASALGQLTREIEAARTRAAAAEAAAAQRDDKIRRMSRSFSWQATSPLRSLRRLALDRVARPAVSSRAQLPATDPSLIYVIDEPASWDDLPPTGRLRGWVITRDGTAVVGMRLRAVGRTFDSTYGLVRADVAENHATNSHALRSGFILEYSLPPQTDQLLSLEALTGDGTWRCFAAVIVRVGSELPDNLRRDYSSWVRRFDTPSLEQTVTIRARVESLAADRRPLISILLPTYNTPEPWLSKAIESVRSQLYPHWELCIADDASTTPHVRRVLDDFARRDSRIKVAYRDQNGHISAASNTALAFATGEFTALLDHDDELAPHALAEIIFALVRNPSLEFLYSDEDKIDEQGRRFDPYFKPDWNPDLLLGQNYTCHLSVFRTARLRAIDGFREGYEGSQDWDLTLRATEGLAPAQVQHIPKVLYHWRAIPGSTALVIDQKSDYPFIAAKKALGDHLARTHTAAELISVTGRHWRIKRDLPTAPPKVSIIIPTRNGESLLRLSIGSLLAKTTYPNFEIIVVNNRSDDPATLGYFDEIRQAGARVLDYDAPFNFSALNNFAAREASGSVLAFLNNDLEVISPDWLNEMTSHALRPEIGCVGAMLYYPNDTVQHAGAVLGLTGPAGKDGVAGHAFKCFPRGAEGQRNRLRLVQNYSAVTAACLVIRRDIFEAVGGFNEADLAVAFNDIDFCLRVQKAGYRNLWTPFAEFYHHESASRGHEDTPEKIARFQREVSYMRETWGSALDRDPAYNPNLSLQHEDFSLSFPPR